MTMAFEVMPALCWRRELSHILKAALHHKKQSSYYCDFVHTAILLSSNMQLKALYRSPVAEVSLTSRGGHTS